LCWSHRMPRACHFNSARQVVAAADLGRHVFALAVSSVAAATHLSWCFQDLGCSGFI
jgi:hypothetical protein